VDVYMRRVVAERPHDLMLLLHSGGSDAELEQWLRGRLLHLEDVSDEVVVSWRMRLRGMARTLVHNSLEELEDLRHKRRYFSLRLEEALDHLEAAKRLPDAGVLAAPLEAGPLLQRSL